MDVGVWCNPGLKNYDRFPSTGTAKAPTWRVWWRKIKRGRKKMFEHGYNYCYSGCSSMRFQYDLDSYAQNFDAGSVVWDDFNDLSRSFSARFASIPSTIFQDQIELS